MSQLFEQWCQENFSKKQLELEMQHLRSKVHNQNGKIGDTNNKKDNQHVKHPAQQEPLHLESRKATCNFMEPQQIYRKLVLTGKKKSKVASRPHMWWLILWQAIFAGIYIGLGDVLLLTVGAQAYNIKHNDPGVAKIIIGSFGLPFGLTLVVLTGAELFTSNTCYLSAALFEGCGTFLGLLGNWFVSYFGNLMGALLLCVWVKACHLFHDHEDAVQGIAIYKTSNDFGVVFLRGILCNWCVNLAVWQATAAQDIAGKFVGIFLPISAFVAIGFEHSVANMFLIPFGMMHGADISVGQFLTNNLIPATLGNIVAGALIMAGSYGMFYGSLSDRLVHFFVRSEETNLRSQKSMERVNVQKIQQPLQQFDLESQVYSSEVVTSDASMLKWGE